MRTKSVRNFQLVLSWSSLYPEANSRKVKSPLGTVTGICTSCGGCNERMCPWKCIINIVRKGYTIVKGWIYNGSLKRWNVGYTTLWKITNEGGSINRTFTIRKFFRIRQRIDSEMVGEYVLSFVRARLDFPGFSALLHPDIMSKRSTRDTDTGDAMKRDVSSTIHSQSIEIK